MLALAYELAAAVGPSAVLGAVAAGTAICGLWAFREYLFTAAVLGDRTWRPFGPFVNPNALAGHLIIGLPMLIIAVTGLRRAATSARPGHPARVAWPVLAVVTALSLASLVFTASKGALAAAVLALIAVGLAVPRGRWMAAAGLAAVLVVLLAPPTRSRITAAFSTQKKTSFAFRVQTWRGTWRMAAARPLTGWGPGTFRRVYPKFALVPFTSMAHSSWLQIAAESGLPAAALLVAGLVACAVWSVRASGASPLPQLAAASADETPARRRAKRLRKKRTGRSGQAPSREAALVRSIPWPGIGPAAAVGVVAMLLHNLVDYTWYLPAVALTAMAILGAAAAVRARENHSGNWPSPAPNSRQRTAQVAALVVAAAMCLWQGQAAVSSDAAAAAARQGYIAAAEQAAAAAARRAVFSPDAWIVLGKIREAAAGTPPRAADLLAAAEAYRRAAMWAPTEPGALIGAARCLRLAGHASEAVAWGKAAACAYPRGPAALLEFARCLEAAGRQDDALAVYRKTMALARTEYGRYPPLEGWADWHIAAAAAAVARATSGPERLNAWRVAATVLRDYLSWTLHYREPMAVADRLDAGLLSELSAIAYDAAAALAQSPDRADRELAHKLEALVAKF